MAIVQTGSTLQLTIGANTNTGTVSTTITVPSDAELVVVGVADYCNSVNGFYTTGSMTFTKGGADTAMTSVTTLTDTTSNLSVAMFYLALPDTGANKTLKWDWLGTGTSTQDFGICSITFWKGVNTASPVRSGSGGINVTAPPYTTGTLTAQTGDLILAFAGAYTGSTGETDVTGWSNLTSLSSLTHLDFSSTGQFCDAAWATGSPSGNTTVGVTTTTSSLWQDGAIAAMVIKPAPTTPTFYQSKISADGSATNATTVAATFTSPVSLNSLVYGHVVWDGGGSSVLTGIADDKGNTYTIIDTINDPNIEKYVTFYKEGITNAPITITATFSPTTDQRRISICEYAGCATTSALDGHAAQVQTGATTAANNLTSTAFTTTTNGDLICGSFWSGSSVPSAGTSPNAFTSRIAGVGGETWKLMSEDFVQTTAGSVAATASISVADWSTSMGAAFKPAAVAAPAAVVAPRLIPRTMAFQRQKPWLRQMPFQVTPAPSGPLNYPMAADPGVFTVAGVAANLSRARVSSETVGAFNVNGIAAGLRHGYVPLPAVSGGFILAGYNTGLAYGHMLKAVVGAFNVSGIATGLRTARTMPAATGAFTVNGVPATLTYRHNFPMSAVVGAFNVTGNATGLLATRKMVATVATFTIGGIAAGLKFGHVMSAAPGAFGVTGVAAGLKYGRVAKSVVGTFNVSGTTTNFFFNHVTKAVVGTFAVNGTATGLRAARIAAAAPGSFVVNGVASILKRTRISSETVGAFVINGVAVNLTWSASGAKTLPAVTGTFAVGGVAANFKQTFGLRAVTGAFSVAGTTTGLRAARILPTVTGAFTIGSFATALRAGRRVTCTAGPFTINGQPVGLAAARKLALVKGSFLVNGINAVLNYSAAGNRVMAALSGAFPVTGMPANLVISHKFAAVTGAFTVNGFPAILTRGRQEIEVPGVFVVSGKDANLVLVHKYRMAASYGTFRVAGPEGGLSRSGTEQPGAMEFGRQAYLRRW